jgi:hypothetical protein
MLWVGAGIGAMSLGTGLLWLIAPRWRRRAAETEGRAARVVRSRRRAGGLTTIIVDKGVDVPLSIPEAFAVWGRLDNLPRFVPYVRAVREVAVDRHRWELGRPGEPPIELDTRITRFGSHRVVAWETMPGRSSSTPGASGCARARRAGRGWPCACPTSFLLVPSVTKWQRWCRRTASTMRSVAGRPPSNEGHPARLTIPPSLLARADHVVE